MAFKPCHCFERISIFCFSFLFFFPAERSQDTFIRLKHGKRLFTQQALVAWHTLSFADGTKLQKGYYCNSFLGHKRPHARHYYVIGPFSDRKTTLKLSSHDIILVLYMVVRSLGGKAIFYIDSIFLFLRNALSPFPGKKHRRSDKNIILRRQNAAITVSNVMPFKREEENKICFVSRSTEPTRLKHQKTIHSHYKMPRFQKLFYGLYMKYILLLLVIPCPSMPH